MVFEAHFLINIFHIKIILRNSQRPGEIFHPNRTCNESARKAKVRVRSINILHCFLDAFNFIESFWNEAFVVLGIYLNLVRISKITCLLKNRFHASDVFRRIYWNHGTLLRNNSARDALIIIYGKVFEQILLRTLPDRYFWNFKDWLILGQFELIKMMSSLYLFQGNISVWISTTMSNCTCTFWAQSSI